MNSTPWPPLFATLSAVRGYITVFGIPKLEKSSLIRGRLTINYADPFAVAVVNRNIVGYVLKKFFSVFGIFVTMEADAVCGIYHKEGLKYLASWLFWEKKNM